MYLKRNRILFSLSAFSSAAAIALALISSAAAQTGGVGQAPAAGSVTTAPNAANFPTGTGLKPFFRKYGRFSTSVDAAGSNGASHIVTIQKPAANSTVVRAFLLAASWGSSALVPIGNSDITIDGTAVSWSSVATNGRSDGLLQFYSVMADVTTIAQAKLDANPAGSYTFTLAELANNINIDGEILVVVFRNPNQTQKQTVALLFGGEQLSGDRFELSFAQPFGPKAGKHAFMGLGISFGFQSTGVTDQFSTIDVNGARLSTSAGGQDDGGTFNGGLITAGGVGDSTANPADPNALPTGDPRFDDELYNLLPFIKKTSTNVVITTFNQSNDDNIFFAWFETSAKTFVNKDTDGDGLLDDWEKNGYDHDGNGTIDVPLQRWGFDYRHKDICIMYAWMDKSPTEAKSHKPSNGARNAVIASFARAPVSNPDGLKGVKVHFRSKGVVPHDPDLNPVWTQFDAIMDPLVTPAERVICHRLLNAHQYSGGTSSGLSRGLPASDFIESLGAFPTNPGTLKQRAGTIMHELGHNLGLHHGGSNDVNWKPNHLSIMSYLNQLDWLTRNGRPYLDYERFDLQALDETNLKERAGLNRVGSDNPLKKYGVRWHSGATALSKGANANKRVDWNNNGTPTDAGVNMDLNRTGTSESLATNFVEWDNLIYDGGAVGASGNKVPNLNYATDPNALVELDLQMYEEFKRNMVEVAP